VPPGVGPSGPRCTGDAPMTEQQTATCAQCSRTISPEDTLVFGYGRLGHLECRRPRVLSAEERTLLFIYCRDTQSLSAVVVEASSSCVVSLDSFGIHTHGCPWCHTESDRQHPGASLRLRDPSGGSTTQSASGARGGAKLGEAKPAAAGRGRCGDTGGRGRAPRAPGALRQSPIRRAG
jgi:hypothetical protein